MQDIELHSNIKIEVDQDDPDRVWIYMLDQRSGEPIEGGSFDSQAFMDVVLKFYNSNY